MKKALCILLLACLCGLTACAPAKPAEANIFAMDTYMAFVAYGDQAEKALYDSVKNVQAIEDLLSRTKQTSEVFQLNENGAAALSSEARFVLQTALQHSGETGGLFDVTVAPLVELWNITGETPHIATDEEIAALLGAVGAEHVHIGGDTVTLDEGTAIDLGGIGKGYAGDVVANTMRQYGVTGGTASLGGNVVVVGTKPDGKLWTVAIQDPASTDYACMLTLTDCAVVTSGGYQRYFTAEDGTVYHHILDPRTGKPADSDLVSVSIVCDSSTRADAYSTAVYIMGETDAIAFWQSYRNFDMVLITADGRLLYTPGLADKITFTEGAAYEAQLIN